MSGTASTADKFAASVVRTATLNRHVGSLVALRLRSAEASRCGADRHARLTGDPPRPTLRVPNRSAYRMTTVTVSPKFQVVIPLDAREALGITPGQKIEVIAYDGRLEFILISKPKKMRGFVRGIDTSVPRDADRK